MKNLFVIVLFLHSAITFAFSPRETRHSLKTWSFGSRYIASYFPCGNMGNDGFISVEKKFAGLVYQFQTKDTFWDVDNIIVSDNGEYVIIQHTNVNGFDEVVVYKRGEIVFKKRITKKIIGKSQYYHELNNCIYEGILLNVIESSNEIVLFNNKENFIKFSFDDNNFSLDTSKFEIKIEKSVNKIKKKVFNPRKCPLSYQEQQSIIHYLEDNNLEIKYNDCSKGILIYLYIYNDGKIEFYDYLPSDMNIEVVNKLRLLLDKFYLINRGRNFGKYINKYSYMINFPCN